MSLPGQPKVALPPLLPPGRHIMTMAGLKKLCVDAFPASVNRPKLYPELQRLVADLITWNIICELCIDGSFLTEKPEPDDIDLSFSSWASDFSTIDTTLQGSIVNALNGGHRYSPVLDTYISFRFLRDDPRKAADMTEYWAEKWGVGWDNHLKGYAVIKLGESDVGLRLCA